MGLQKKGGYNNKTKLRRLMKLVIAMVSILFAPLAVQAQYVINGASPNFQNQQQMYMNQQRMQSQQIRMQQQQQQQQMQIQRMQQQQRNQQMQNIYQQY